MGISGLARRLEPYAIQYSPDQLDRYSAVIDGPALAYFGHKLAVIASKDATKLPSYQEICMEAIRWLGHLENINVKVSTIFFDGALPKLKQVERLSRLDQNNKRVLQLRASYPTESCPIPRPLASILYAFLAPALREALAASPYAARTRIVPGEADDWCALYAKDLDRSLVFTSDTDLVLYDYPKETLIVFLHDVDLSSGIRAYSPDQIRQRLHLQSLVPFAYALCQSPQDTANTLIQNARSVNLSSDGYVDFNRRYTPSASTSANRRETTSDALKLQDLDVRISEYVDQVLSSSRNPLVYLPLLVEDPGQASAWNMGHDVRKFAYSLLAPMGTVVHEYRRKSQSVSAQDIQIFTAAEAVSVGADMEQQISGLILWATSKRMKPELLWPLFGLSLVLADLNTPPAIPLVLRVLNADFDNTWAFIQLTARVQAAMYSLRVLKQIVNVKLAQQKSSDTGLNGSLNNIKKHMSLFPSIGDMFTIPGQAKKILGDHDSLRVIVEEIYASAGAEVPSEHVSNKKKKRQAREADRKKRKAGMRQMTGF